MSVLQFAIARFFQIVRTLRVITIVIGALLKMRQAL